MAVFTQIALLLFLLSLVTLINCSENKTATTVQDNPKEELVQSESKDGKLEIIKQIKKVNDDGSYTIGYEADDGSFKIESRDVLGNIKGTYGYVDDSGQIKRVSYSTSNSSEVLSKIPESSVVQRIPKIGKMTTTQEPALLYSTTPTSVRYPKIRNYSSSFSGTTKSNIVGSSSENGEALRSSEIYSTPRVLLQGRPLLRSTPAPQIQKSEGQILRPEVVSVRPTELPLFRRLALKHLETAKAVVNEPEIKGNILRRQLNQEKNNFDPQQHVFNLQQSLGNDATDVYSASMTTGTPRPLFTTTNRPRTLLSTTVPAIVARAPATYHTNYQRYRQHDIEPSTSEYAHQDTSTTESNLGTTSTAVPVVQIPANRPPTPEPLVAIKHPFQRGAILVPLSQIQAGRVLIDDGGQYYQPHHQPYVKENLHRTLEPTTPVLVRRLPPPQFRPVPVQVDENGFIRDVPLHNGPTAPYPLPIPITPAPKFVTNEVDSDVDSISPPVSTRDFQKLLQQLIIRQSRLERISALTDPRRHPDLYRSRQLYRTTQAPYFIQRVPENQQAAPVHVLGDQRYVAVDPRQPTHIAGQHRQEAYQDASYVPTRRVARLLPADPLQQTANHDEYLPPNVREMLLLRMLQLAINPALPLEEDDFQATTAVSRIKKLPVRNVEILGEETEEEEKMRLRTKRNYEK